MSSKQYCSPLTAHYSLSPLTTPPTPHPLLVTAHHPLPTSTARYSLSTINYTFLTTRHSLATTRYLLLTAVRIGSRLPATYTSLLSGSRASGGNAETRPRPEGLVTGLPEHEVQQVEVQQVEVQQVEVQQVEVKQVEVQQVEVSRYRAAGNIPHHATPRHTTLHHATPRHATPRHATPRHTTPNHTKPHPNHNPNPTQPYPALPTVDPVDRCAVSWRRTTSRRPVSQTAVIERGSLSNQRWVVYVAVLNERCHVFHLLLLSFITVVRSTVLNAPTIFATLATPTILAIHFLYPSYPCCSCYTFYAHAKAYTCYPCYPCYPCYTH